MKLRQFAYLTVAEYVLAMPHVECPLKACARTSVNLLCQKHLIKSINPLLNRKCYFSWVGAESSNATAELEINHEEKLAHKILLYKQIAILDLTEDANKTINESINILN